MPTIDTILNILAVILAAAAVALGATAVYYIRASRAAIQHLPENIAPVRKELISLRAEAENVAELLKETGDWMARYDSVLKDNIGLKAQVQKLIAQNDALHGEIVQLNDMGQRLVSVYNSQMAQNERQAHTINEQMKLIEQLTQALDAKNLNALHQELTVLVSELREFIGRKGNSSEVR